MSAAVSTWERSVLALLDDLEQQAEGLHLLERDLEVADRVEAEYASVTAVARWHASVGRDLRVRLLGGRQVSGRLARAGQDWLLLAASGSQWVVPSRAVLSAAGVSPRATAAESWSVVDRLGLRSVLRGVARSGGECVVHGLDGQELTGRLGRVGADFVELQVVDGAVQVVPTHAVAAVQQRGAR